MSTSPVNTVQDATTKRRVSFMETFGLDDDSDVEPIELNFGAIGDDDFFLANEDDETPQPTTITSYNMGSDSEDFSDDDGEGDIYDAYEWDHDKLAEVVKAGAEQKKLEEVIQASMAAAFERQIRAKTAPKPKPLSMRGSPYADLNDISGMMTPGRMTPDEGAEAQTPGSGLAASPEDIKKAMTEAMDSAKARRRRSSAARKAEGADAISQAMDLAKKRHRRSIAGMLSGSPSAGDDISNAMEKAKCRHRLSVSKAADVLESAGYGESSNTNEVDQKLNMVQQAMENARQRHRKSIAEAVRNIQDPPEFKPSFKPGAENTPEFKPSFKPGSAGAQPFVPGSAGAQPFVPGSAGAQPFVPGSAGEHQQSQETWNTESPWKQAEYAMQNQSTWGSDACWEQQGSDTCWEQQGCDLQSRMNQVVQSAYNQHCYTEEWGNPGGEWQDSYSSYTQGQDCQGYGAQSGYGQQSTYPPAYGQQQQTMHGQTPHGGENSYGCNQGADACNQPSSWQGANSCGQPSSWQGADACYQGANSCGQPPWNGADAGWQGADQQSWQQPYGQGGNECWQGGCQVGDGSWNWQQGGSAMQTVCSPFGG